jgi:hypothetical protein
MQTKQVTWSLDGKTVELGFADELLRLSAEAQWFADQVSKTK